MWQVNSAALRESGEEGHPGTGRREGETETPHPSKPLFVSTAYCLFQVKKFCVDFAASKDVDLHESVEVVDAWM